MPIANCVVTAGCQETDKNLVDIWARESEQSSDNMTVNIVAASNQYGSKYAVMATLYLPSLWSRPAISSLQIGLAVALAEKYSVSIDQVHVITSVVESGYVVESGKEVTW